MKVLKFSEICGLVMLRLIHLCCSGDGPALWIFQNPFISSSRSGQWSCCSESHELWLMDVCAAYLFHLAGYSRLPLIVLLLLLSVWLFGFTCLRANIFDVLGASLWFMALHLVN